MNRWYVLFKKSRKEAQIQQQPEGKGIATFLPMTPRKQGTDASAVDHYSLATCLRSWSAFLVRVGAARWTPGLTTLLSFGVEYAVVQDEVVDYLRGRVRVEEQNARAPSRRGQRVRLAADCPLGPLEAIFEHELSGGKRARVLLEILGRLTRSKVGIEDICRMASAEGVLVPMRGARSDVRDHTNGVG